MNFFLILSLFLPAPSSAPSAAPLSAAPLTEADKRELSFKCQAEMRATKNGEYDPFDICICNSKVGLPENASCRKSRKQTP